MPTSLKLPSILESTNADRAIQHLRAYFGESSFEPSSEDGFTGSRFETVGGPWNEPTTLNAITPSDLVAVSTLSVDVPARAAIRLLDQDAEEISGLLSQIPATLDLWEARNEDIATHSPSGKLWSLLRQHQGMGPTKTSKLIARKRPRLAPVYDSVVAGALKMKSSSGHWEGMRDLMNSTTTGQPLYQHLTDMARSADLGPLVTPLRVFDVVVWMEHRSR